ncbi:hypothetical protein [Pseudoalteromonas sp. PB2-1]|uniref:hypothetical protein n=1 Tax=Pseudoalteromonas sp. PB2-1 TaxID=2907242 RepID=UPI003704BBE4
MTQTTSHTAPTYQPIDDALAPWQKAIYEGNLSFECGDLVVARDHYTVAANIAETLMAQFTNIPYSHYSGGFTITLLPSVCCCNA